MIGFGRAPCDEGVIRAGGESTGCAERAQPWVLCAALAGALCAAAMPAIPNRSRVAEARRGI